MDINAVSMSMVPSMTIVISVALTSLRYNLLLSPMVIKKNIIFTSYCDSCFKVFPISV